MQISAFKWPSLFGSIFRTGVDFLSQSARAPVFCVSQDLMTGGMRQLLSCPRNIFRSFTKLFNPANSKPDPRFEDYRGTIYGTPHDNSREEREMIKKLLIEARERGVAKVGLELSAEMAQSSFSNNLFTFAHYHVQKLGMHTVYLDDYELYRRSGSISLLSQCINASGEIDIDIIETTISNIRKNIKKHIWELELRRQRHDHHVIINDTTNEIEALNSKLEDIEALKSLLLSHPDYSLEDFGRLWDKSIVIDREKHMTGVIENEKPDIAIIGGAHLAGLERSLSIPYHFISLQPSFEEAVQENFPDLNVHSSTFKTLKEMSKPYSVYYAITLLEKMVIFVRDLSRDTDINGSQALNFLERVINKDPDFPRLFVRYQGLRNVKDFPLILYVGVDAKILSMTKEEIETRISVALKAAQFQT